jgi:hypothetical protein
MSLLDILDERSTIRVVVTDEMRKKAALVGIEYAQMNDCTVDYELAMDAFKQAIYQANPHLDPNEMRKADGKPMYTQRIDMERATGKLLNDLIAEETLKLNPDATDFPRPFDEKNLAHTRV